MEPLVVTIKVHMHSFYPKALNGASFIRGYLVRGGEDKAEGEMRKIVPRKLRKMMPS
jgi:hypothetical protein